MIGERHHIKSVLLYHIYFQTKDFYLETGLSEVRSSFSRLTFLVLNGETFHDR